MTNPTVRARSAVALPILAIAACSSASEPTIGLDDLQGEYVTPGCKPVRIEGTTLVAGEHRVPFELKRDGDGNYLELTSRLAHEFIGCRPVVLPEPTKIPVRGPDPQIILRIDDATRGSTNIFRKPVSARPPL